MNTFTIVYPGLLKETGQVLRAFGHFKVLYDKELGIMPVISKSPIIEDVASSPPGTVLILDPRAIVFNESTGIVDYSPRYYEEYQLEWVRKWLDERAHWGIPGCELDWNKAIQPTQTRGAESIKTRNDDKLSRGQRRPIPPRLRFEIMRRDGFRCQYCGATPQEKRLEVDHIIPISKGGTNDPGNLITACADCNRGKSDSDVIAA